LTPANAPDLTKVALGVDPLYLVDLSCVFCLAPEKIVQMVKAITDIYSIPESMVKKTDYLNPDLRYPGGKWIYYSQNTPPESEGLTSLGKHFWITKTGATNRLLPKLVPFLLTPTAITSDTSSSPGSGSGNGKSKRLSVGRARLISTVSATDHLN
jgi:hypothetical protein